MIVVALGLAIGGLGVLMCNRSPGIPILVEGTVDIGGFFTDSFDDPIDIGPGEVRLEGRQAEEFWAIVKEGTPADIKRRSYVSGGRVVVYFNNGKKESVGLYYYPIVALYDYRKEIGFWYILDIADKATALNQQRLRDLLRPCFEQTQRKYNEKQAEIKKSQWSTYEEQKP